jgi:hypothetical protein
VLGAGAFAYPVPIYRSDSPVNERADERIKDLYSIHSSAIGERLSILLAQARSIRRFIGKSLSMLY